MVMSTGVVVKASASQLADRSLIPLPSHAEVFENNVYCFGDRRLAEKVAWRKRRHVRLFCPVIKDLMGYPKWWVLVPYLLLQPSLTKYYQTKHELTCII